MNPLLDFIHHKYEDGLQPVDRRWAMKNFRGFFPIMEKYAHILDRRIVNEDHEKSKNYIYVNTFYSPEAAAEPIESEFNGNTRLYSFPPEYIFVVEEEKNGSIIYNYEEEFKLIYAGYHWNSILGLLYTMFHKYPTNSFMFQELAEVYRYDKDHQYNWTSLDKHLGDEEIVMSVFEAFFNVLFRDLRTYMCRYIIFYQDDIRRRDGLSFLLPEIKELFSSEMLDKINTTFLEILSDKEYLPEVTEYDVPTVKPNVIFPSGRPSLEQENKDLTVEKLTNLGGGILCYKVINDTVLDTVRMRPSERPYHRSARYDPPITRGVSRKDQPYRFEVVNSEIDYNDIDGDTVNMRKVVISDMLTRTLDWAAKNKLPLPPLGTEFYIHAGDSAPESLSKLGLMCSVYSRKRRDQSFLIPLPDYSYQTFSVKTRFHISEGVSMTWDATKEYLLANSPKTPISKRISNIFFRGNEFSHSGIRKDLYYLQDKDIKDHNKVIIPSKVLKIEIPKLSEKEELPPIPIPDMGKFKILLDLPGYGMWSNRLKFISLTGSYVVRIIYIEHEWDKKASQWMPVNTNDDIWETFTDSFLPVEFTHTIIGNHYKGVPKKEETAFNEMMYQNRISKMKILNKLSNIYNNINKPEYQVRMNKIKDRVSNVTDDQILEYMYEVIMRQAYYYGFIVNQI